MNKLTSLVLALVFALVNTLPLMGSGVVSADPVNLIPNPSVESETSGKPTSWTNSKQGTNTTTFTYLNTGHSGSRSLEINMTKRSSGSA